MRKRLKDIIARKTDLTRMNRPMNTIVLILLGILIIAALAFLVSLFRLPLEDADFWLKVISGVLAAFTFLSGAAALVTGQVLGNRQAEKVLTLDKDVAEARAKQAEAELRLEEVRAKQRSRGIRWEEFRGHLKGKPTGEVMIVCIGGSPEVVMFAEHLGRIIEQGGWKVSKPVIVQSMADVTRKGSTLSEVALVAREYDFPLPPHIEALEEALRSLGYTYGASGDRSLPDNKVRVVIGPRV